MRSLAAAGYSIEIRTLLPGRYLRQMDAANLQDRENQRAGHAEARRPQPSGEPEKPGSGNRQSDQEHQPSPRSVKMAYRTLGVLRRHEVTPFDWASLGRRRSQTRDPGDHLDLRGSLTEVSPFLKCQNQALILPSFGPPFGH